jgi:hypothetical protein
MSDRLPNGVDRHVGFNRLRLGETATQFPEETDACFIVKDHAGLSLA